MFGDTFKRKISRDDSNLFRYHCMNTTLSMISAWVQFINHELDPKEGTIGMKIVGQGNKK